MRIAIEGIDGSGKTSLLHELEGLLKECGKNVLVRSYPVYEGFIGRKIGELLAGAGSYSAATTLPEAMAALYAIDRYQDYKEHELAFCNADFVLLNRYTLSSMVYQSLRSARPVDTMAWVDQLEHKILGLPRPDQYIIIDTPPDLAHGRIVLKGERAYAEGQSHDAYEADRDLQEKARIAYRQFCIQNQNAFLLSSENQGHQLSPRKLAEQLLKEVIRL